MKVPLFVTSSAALLALWLGVTFVHQVSPEDYPQLERASLPVAAKAGPQAAPEALISLEEPPGKPVAAK